MPFCAYTFRITLYANRNQRQKLIVAPHLFSISKAIRMNFTCYVIDFNYDLESFQMLDTHHSCQTKFDSLKTRFINTHSCIDFCIHFIFHTQYECLIYSNVVLYCDFTYIYYKHIYYICKSTSLKVKYTANTIRIHWKNIWWYCYAVYGTNYCTNLLI